MAKQFCTVFLDIISTNEPVNQTKRICVAARLVSQTNRRRILVR